MTTKRKRSQYVFDFDDEIIVDLFAGGGGMSTAMHNAVGISPHIACNHDAEAIAMHEANHPQTEHYRADVFELDPYLATGAKRARQPVASHNGARIWRRVDVRSGCCMLHPIVPTTARLLADSRVTAKSARCRGWCCAGRDRCVRV